MFIARNQLAIPVAYSELSTIRAEADSPITKLSVHVFNDDVIMQVSEDPNGAFQNPTDTEAQLPMGFSTLVPVQPWYAVRFRAEDATPPAPVMIIRAYGS